jgi:hypothetical protein
MRLNEVKAFLQGGVFYYRPQNGEIDPFGECLKKIKTNKTIHYQDRLALIALFKERVAAVLSENEAKTYLELADAGRQSLMKTQKNVEKRICFYADKSLKAFREKQSIFIEHLVLDSFAKKNGFTARVAQSEAIIFYHRILKDYIDYRKNAGLPAVSGLPALHQVLWQAFCFSLTLGTLKRTEDRSLRRFFLEFEYHLQLMKKGKESALPYLLIPIQENDRAMIARINWNKESGFSWVLVNTGQDAISCEEVNFGCDLLLEGLNTDQVKELVRKAVLPNQKIPKIYDRLLSDLHIDQVHEDRRHHLHQGVSSESKSLASAIHGILGTSLYRDFKLFLTRCLIKDQPKSADIVTVLQRRKKKALGHRQ